MLMFSLDGDALMVSNDADNKQDLRNLATLHDITKQYATNEARRNGIDTDNITINVIQGTDNKRYDVKVIDNYYTLHQIIRNFYDGKGNIPYLIMEKYGEELIVCELSHEDNKHHYWRVLRTRKFSYGEINYLANVLREAKLYNLASLET